VPAGEQGNPRELEAAASRVRSDRLAHPDVWHLLVVERQWSPERYEEWFADTAVAQLLR
jgi:hypothetical protein